MDITVRQLLNVAGGNTKVIIESHEYENKVYWNGTVDDWFADKSEIKQELNDKNIQHLTVINDEDNLILMVD